MKSHRTRLSDQTRTALLDWITVDNRVSSSSTSLDGLLPRVIAPFGSRQFGYSFNIDCARSVLMENETLVGKNLRNPLAIGTVLRLLRFLDNDLKDKPLLDILTITKSNRKCVAILASLPEWQTCLFPLISETLEVVSSRGQKSSDQINSEIQLKSLQ